MGFETMPTAESFKDKKEDEFEKSGPYGRVSKAALSLLEYKDKEFFSGNETKIKELLNDPQFKDEVRKKWQEQTLKGHVDQDPEEQEKLWANGLAERVKFRLSQ